VGDPRQCRRDHIAFQLCRRFSLELLPHTKRAEHPVEDILDFHRSNQLFERVDGSPEMDGSNRRRKSFFPPGLFESFEFRAGSTDRLAMAGSRQYRDIGNDLPVSGVQRIVDRGKQFLSKILTH